MKVDETVAEGLLQLEGEDLRKDSSKVWLGLAVRAEKMGSRIGSAV